MGKQQLVKLLTGVCALIIGVTQAAADAHTEWLNVSSVGSSDSLGFRQTVALGDGRFVSIYNKDSGPTNQMAIARCWNSDGTVAWNFATGNSRQLILLSKAPDGTLVMVNEAWEFIRIDTDGNEVFRYDHSFPQHGGFSNLRMDSTGNLYLLHLTGYDIFSELNSITKLDPNFNVIFTREYLADLKTIALFPSGGLAVSGITNDLSARAMVSFLDPNGVELNQHSWEGEGFTHLAETGDEAVFAANTFGRILLFESDGGAPEYERTMTGLGGLDAVRFDSISNTLYVMADDKVRNLDYGLDER